MSQGNGKAVKVVVASPCSDHVVAMWAHDYARMLGHTIRNRPEIEICSMFRPGSCIPIQREMLAREAVHLGWTHILWLDTDMRFPPDTLLRLLDRHKRIVSANYVERRPPYSPIAFADLQTPDVRVFTEPGDTGLVEVQAVGFGVILMEMDVFRTVAEPWFAVAWDPKAKEFAGEDVYFCAKARDAGERIWVDHDLSQEIAHVGSHNFSMAEARQARELGMTRAEQPESVS